MVNTNGFKSAALAVLILIAVASETLATNDEIATSEWDHPPQVSVDTL
ncbi:MAG: hypothetical protein AAF641_15440 [Pseudomonadota bacterium]